MRTDIKVADEASDNGQVGDKVLSHGDSDPPRVGCGLNRDVGPRLAVSRTC